ncbi:Rrf2 family transcriptional regulator [Treponema sp. OMZ 305]|uniref:Rrf2 family transcriptional regulator n=1 Tax=Treponema TaxID=157 RepID=UPI001BB03966|nr:MULTISPECIES: Rrf2 family transcriptional regulator [Treponema]QUY17681.1 Rrf2 family transcriptional regulator [Treponema vincentii]UTC57567.1 Rrf2 family transcriptional regulator [Treponema sp. OMZ 305]
MKISVRFTAAVHTLLCIQYFEKDMRVTSDVISASTGVNAVIIRKILLQLQKAGLVKTAAGVGGSHLAKSADTITLLDVYNAINEGEEERDIFNFHPKPNPKCPVGSNIHRVLDSALEDAQNAMKDSLNKTTIADLSIDSRGSVP